VASAQSAAERIKSLAKQLARGIEAQGRAEEAKYLPIFKENQELRIFLDQLRVLAETLKERTTIVVDWRSDPWRLFATDGRIEPAVGAPSPVRIQAKQGAAAVASSQPALK